MIPLRPILDPPPWDRPDAGTEPTYEEDRDYIADHAERYDEE